MESEVIAPTAGFSFAYLSSTSLLRQYVKPSFFHQIFKIPAYEITHQITSFNIPATAKQATLLVYDQLGMIVKQVSIADRGMVSVRISASGLKSGIYTCSLLVDGKFYSKKIVVAQ